jgi:hypothetical protein
MGVVYFVRGRTSHLIKIGRATNFGTRLSAIRSQSPESIEVLGVIEADDPVRLEAEIHARFAVHRERGEWFRDEQRLFDGALAKLTEAERSAVLARTEHHT